MIFCRLLMWTLRICHPLVLKGHFLHSKMSCLLEPGKTRRSCYSTSDRRMTGESGTWRLAAISIFSLAMKWQVSNFSHYQKFRTCYLSNVIHKKVNTPSWVSQDWRLIGQPHHELAQTGDWLVVGRHSGVPACRRCGAPRCAAPGRAACACAGRPLVKSTSLWPSNWIPFMGENPPA